MEIKRTLSQRNLFNTNYKAYAIVFKIPFVGWNINEFLFKHGKSVYSYNKGNNEVAYKF